MIEEKEVVNEELEDKILLVDDIRRFAFSIMCLPTDLHDDWCLTDGKNTFDLKVSDEFLVRKIRAVRRIVSRQDVILCNVRFRQWLHRGGLETRQDIVEVLEHRSPWIAMQFDESA